MRNGGFLCGLGSADLSLSLREWVLKSGMLIAMSVYTYLRLIVDHGAPNLLPLRQKEVDFCISMLREKVRARRSRKCEVPVLLSLPVALTTTVSRCSSTSA